MSKKSRRRNRKLIMLALAGGAAAMAARNKGNVSKTAAMEDANIGTNAPILGTDHIKKAVIEKAAADSAADAGRTFEGNTRLKRGGVGPNESVIAQRNIPGHGTAVAPPGILNPYNRHANKTRLRTFKSGGSVKKAKVTGIAKRGFGRALMKGKR